MIRAAVLVLFIAVGVQFVQVPAARAAEVDAGKVVVTAPTSKNPITRGGSATQFTMRLPKNATCPGDSADDGYRVESFFVPKGTKLEAMRYRGQGPVVDGGWAVYKTTTNPFMQEFTDDAEKKGDPGAILPLPALSFAVFTGGELEPGEYHMGVACSRFGETKKYWDTVVLVEADPDDRPAHLRWKLVGVSSSRDSPAMALGALVIVAGAVLVIVVAVRRGSPVSGAAAGRARK